MLWNSFSSSTQGLENTNVEMKYVVEIWTSNKPLLVMCPPFPWPRGIIQMLGVLHQSFKRSMSKVHVGTRDKEYRK